jgi:hypothetical protein
MNTHHIKTLGAVLAATLSLAAAVGADELKSSANPSNDLFLKRCNALAEAAEKENTMTVAGLNGWLFHVPELRHLAAGTFWGDVAPKVSRATKPEFADPLPAITDFNEQLNQLGIRLVIIPVPPKAVVYADQLPGDAPVDNSSLLPRRTDEALQAFYQLLAGRGITVLDLTPAFIAARKDDAQLGPVYCQTDTHWSGRACQIAATQISELIKRNGWLREQGKKQFKTRTGDISITGDLRAGLPATAAESEKPENIKLRFVGTDTEATTAVADDPSSPILLLGDSHCLVFHVGEELHATGAGLADQLAFELGTTIDVMGVRGSGATPARISLYRKSAAAPDYLRQKKVLIWCFSAREFTESQGWRLVPVVGKK